MAALVFTAVPGTAAKLGESPCWDPRTGSLWWTDIDGCRIWRWRTAAGAPDSWPIPAPAGCLVLTAHPQRLLLGLWDRLAWFDAETGGVETLCDVPLEAETRINDGRCDRSGNFVFGTMDLRGERPLGRWWRLDARRRLSALPLPACRIANGLAFSPDGRRLYCCDSRSRRIDCCTYDATSDAASGAIVGLRPFARLDDPDVGVVPDGATVDADGMLWSAEWGGARVTRYRPDGAIDARYPVPTRFPTCPAFGGDGRDGGAMLYLTTAGDAVQAAATKFRGIAETWYAG